MKTFNKQNGKKGIVINNGSAGMPNFKGTNFGLLTRISTRPAPDSLYGTVIDGVHFDAVPIRIPTEHFSIEIGRMKYTPILSELIRTNYGTRIKEGPNFELDMAIRSGIEKKEIEMSSYHYRVGDHNFLEPNVDIPYGDYFQTTAESLDEISSSKPAGKPIPSLKPLPHDYFLKMDLAKAVKEHPEIYEYYTHKEVAEVIHAREKPKPKRRGIELPKASPKAIADTPFRHMKYMEEFGDLYDRRAEKIGDQEEVERLIAKFDPDRKADKQVEELQKMLEEKDEKGEDVITAVEEYIELLKEREMKGK